LTIVRNLAEERVTSFARQLRIFGIVLTVACLALGAYIVDWRETLQVIAGASLGQIALASGCLVGTWCLFSLRWQQLIAVNRPPPIWRIFNFLMIGYLTNALLPARPGDIIRAVLLRQAFGISISYGFAGLVLERLFDAFAICVLGLVVSFIVTLPPLVASGLYGLASIGLGLMIVLLGLSWRRDSIGSITARFPRLFNHIYARFFVEWLARFTSALGTLYSLNRFSMSILLTCLGWGALALATINLIKAFNLNVPPAAALLVLVATNLAAVVPSSPGALGVYHFMAVIALSVWRVDTSIAVAFAIGAHAVFVGLQVILGLSCAWLEGFGMRGLTQLAQTSRQD